MLFTSSTFLLFFLLTTISYWLLPTKRSQNILLLCGSYLFYGWIHPWYCILIASSTLLDYVAGKKIAASSKQGVRKVWLLSSIAWNLSLLGFFKYCNFFLDSLNDISSTLGHSVQFQLLPIVLPVGISFYTFQTLSYTIDIYRKQLEPRESLVDFALFVSFFPQLVAGPIERARRFLPQIESPRSIHPEQVIQATSLMLRGFFKKLVVADNVAVFADQIFSLRQPSMLLLAAGTLAFSVQILADFSGYTDIARGAARLLGFDLVVNFRQPYLAVTPSDFWRRWHISFSSWIRDYVYIPLGGSRVGKGLPFARVIILTMGISGLWHGAAWNFVVWGLYHGALLYCYHVMGFGGAWRPQSAPATLFAWLLMCVFTLFGWSIFRTSSLSWLSRVLSEGTCIGSEEQYLIAIHVIVLTALYSLPLLLKCYIDHYEPRNKVLQALWDSAAFLLLLVFAKEASKNFIYFQF